VVNSTGRVILCTSGDSAHSIPGYQACPIVVVEEAL
jgi:hypothetical protein